MRGSIPAVVVLLFGLAALPALAAPPKAGPGAGDPHVAGAEGAMGEEGHHAGPGHINWIHGFLGEKETLKPGEGDLLWRPKGTPAPFGAWILNTAILFYFVGRFSRRPVADALKKRKLGIMHGIEEASKMKDDAADRLADYEEKLAHISDEIERVKREMREAGEAERARILEEAREKRERVQRDAKILIDQEMKAARELLLHETVATAVSSASDLLAKQLGPQDHERLASEYLAALDRIEIHAGGGKA